MILFLSAALYIIRISVHEIELFLIKTYIILFQFDQPSLFLPSAEYYELGFNHPIIQAYYNVLLNVATLLGAEPLAAKREMKDLIEFEMNLASVSFFMLLLCIILVCFFTFFAFLFH